MPTAYTASDVYPYVRFALTGNPESDVPSDDTLAFIVPVVLAQFAVRFPCAFTNGAVRSDIVSDDAQLRGLYEAIGAEAAIHFLQSPAGNSFAGNIVSTKVGPVTETRQLVGLDAVLAGLRGRATTAILRVACVREAYAAFTTPLFGDVSRRRLIGEPLTVAGAVLAASRREERF